MNQELKDPAPSFTIDVVVITPHKGHLSVALAADAVPWDVPRNGESLNSTARRLASEVTGLELSWIEQAGAFGDAYDHPSGAPISVGFCAVAPLGTADHPEQSFSWHDIGHLPPLPERQRIMVDSAVEMIRDRMDLSPVAFKLLPTSFTLSELQAMYELLLAKRLHKASFRRALQAAWLVEPTDEWRSEGRGRPAQLYRLSGKRRRKARRAVRFDLL